MLNHSPNGPRSAVAMGSGTVIADRIDAYRAADADPALTADATVRAR